MIYLEEKKRLFYKLPKRIYSYFDFEENVKTDSLVNVVASNVKAISFVGNAKASSSFTCDVFIIHQLETIKIIKIDDNFNVQALDNNSLEYAELSKIDSVIENEIIDIKSVSYIARLKAVSKVSFELIDILEFEINNSKIALKSVFDLESTSNKEFDFNASIKASGIASILSYELKEIVFNGKIKTSSSFTLEELVIKELIGTENAVIRSNFMLEKFRPFAASFNPVAKVESTASIEVATYRYRKANNSDFNNLSNASLLNFTIDELYTIKLTDKIIVDREFDSTLLNMTISNFINMPINDLTLNEINI